MAESLFFAPNIPVLLCLADPEGTWDAELRQGHYQTTNGQTFVLPRVAVVALNLLEPRPGEEIQITRHWKGRPSDPIEWTVCLSPRSEQARAREETARHEAESGLDLTAALQASIDRTRSRKTVLEPPSASIDDGKLKIPSTGGNTATERVVPFNGFSTVEPEHRLTRRPVKQEIQPQPQRRNGVIPWNVAFREVSAFVARELAANHLQWSDAAQQDALSTILISAAKAGHIGLWERTE